MCIKNTLACPMRTHIDLDENLVAEVVTMGHFPTKKAAIHAALTELSKTLKRKQLLALRGKVAWEGDLNQLRSTRNTETD
jgi:Arc/MetJ family transcription regulator